MSVSIIRNSTIPMEMLLGRFSFSVIQPLSILHLKWKTKSIQTNNNFISNFHAAVESDRNVRQRSKQHGNLEGSRLF